MKRIASFLMAVIMVITLCLPASVAFAAPELIETATLTVNYYWANSDDTMIHEPYIVHLPVGREYHVPSPQIEGFQLTDESQSIISGALQGEASYSVYYTYEEEEFPYTVKYIGKGSNNKEYELDTFTGTAPANTTVSIPAREFSGWEREESMELSLEVSADGKASKTVYYQRTAQPYIIFQTGGSYVEPITAEAGTDISELVAAVGMPERKGYEFTGWDTEIPTVMPAEDLVITAKWTPGKTTYTVLYWFQNIEDDEYTLNLGENETREGTTEQIVTASEADIAKGETNAGGTTFYGFDYSHADEVTLSGDGKSVLNVYYDREIWTINLYENPVCTNTTLEEYKNLDRKLWKSVSGKYGASTAGVLPSLTEIEQHYTAEGAHPFGDDYTYINLCITDKTDFRENAPISGTTTFFTADTFTQEGIEKTHNVDLFPFYSTEGQRAFHIDVFGQALDEPDTYELLTQSVKVGRAGTPTYLTVYPIKGFTNKNGYYRSDYNLDGKLWINNEEGIDIQKNPDGSYKFHIYDWSEFRQQRVKNTLQFSSKNEIVKSKENVYYETPLDEELKNTVPENGSDSHEQFAGWYLNPDYFDLMDPVTSYKMPETDLTLYAKWEPIDVTVQFDTNGGGEVPSQTVSYNTPASAPENPTKEGALFTGWYLEDGSRWVFDRPVEEDITLYAHWQTSSLVDYTINHIIEGEEEPFAVSEGSGIPGDSIYAAAYTAKDQKYPKGTYLEPTEGSRSIVLDEGSENTATITYTRVGQKEYTVSYLDKTTDKPIREAKREVTLHTFVTEIAPKIQGYDCLDEDGYEVKELSAEGVNEIIFYYQPNGEPVLPGGETGNLTVRKTVSGDEASTTEKFPFRVTLGDDSINGEYGGMTFENGVAEFTLRHGERITAEGLPGGISYAVEEFYADDGISLASSSDVKKRTSGQNRSCSHKHDDNCYEIVEKCVHRHTAKCYPRIELASDSDYSREPSACTHECSESSRCIREVLDCTHEHDDTCDYLLNLSVASSSDGERTVSALADGETNGYAVMSWNASGVIAAGETARVFFNNHKGIGEPVTPDSTGNLEVSKIVSGSGGSRTRAFTFTVTLDDEQINGTYGDMIFENGVATFALKHAGTATASDIPAGTRYEVSESDNDGYTVTKTGDTGLIPDGDTVRCTFENYRRSGNGGGDDDGGGSSSGSDGPSGGTDSQTSGVPITDPSVPLTAGPATSAGGITIPDQQIPLDPLPRTGDENRLANWLILLASSVLGMGAALSLWFRDRREKR